MPLTSGMRLGAHEILGSIGAGAMGEVYRARDSRLARDVAIKVLPERFARDAGRLARFEREAQMLAALSHQNIASIHSLEEHGGIRFLVLELVEGETLHERLRRGALPIDEALDIAAQIAIALEAAHEKGIVHRDLKPANVKIAPDGVVKILDFGIAKALLADSADFASLPTTTGGTAHGIVLGTPAYMSPEQARAKPVDRRTDIWAFGCLLFETLTGQMAFGGETMTDTLAAVIDREPDWAALPARLPRRIHHLLRRLLTKDPRDRLHDIADARIELTGRAADDEPHPIVMSRMPRWTVGLALAAAALIGSAVSVAWMGLRTTPTVSMPLVRFALPLTTPERHTSEFLPIVAVAHDGTRLAYIDGSKAQLYVRSVDRVDATLLPGTAGASGPFFSHDDRWIGFFAGGKLKKIAVAGGTPMVVCDAPNARGGAWAPDDTIIFAPTNRAGLSRVAAGGGEPLPLTTLDLAANERSHRLPEILPGGDAVVFTVEVTASLFDDARIAVVTLRDSVRRTLLEGGYHARPGGNGQLLYARHGAIAAVPFDRNRLELRGPASQAFAGVMQSAVTGAVQFAASPSGMTAYVPADHSLPDARLLWVDADGRSRPITPMERPYLSPRLSRDGSRLVLTVADGANRDLWTYEFARGAMTRLTFEPSLESSGTWTPDGRRLAFSSNRGGARNLYWMAADGSGTIERLTTSNNTQLPGGFTPDGRWLVFEEANPTTGSDVWVLPLDGTKPGQPRPLMQTPFSESGPRLSDDGRWLAYVSDETGRREVYVRPFPDPGGKWQISTDGGIQPMWAPDGRHLFYRSGDRMIAVAIQTAKGFQPSQPRLLFAAPYDVSTLTNYDVGADGAFVMIQGGDRATNTAQLMVTLDNTTLPQSAR